MSTSSKEEQKQQQQEQGDQHEDKKIHKPRSGSATASRKPPLHRNNACLPCRKKKRKCDAKHPVCTPCMNSARLYQEEPQCEWGTSTPAPRSDDGHGGHGHGLAHVKPEEDNPLASSSSSALFNLPPLPLPASLNPNLASDSNLLYTAYDPSYGTFNPGKDGTSAQDLDASQYGNTAAAATAASSSSSGAGGRRKSLKRDNNSTEVDDLQARIAELEAKLQLAQAAIYGSSSGSAIPPTLPPTFGDDHQQQQQQTSSNASAQHVHFTEKLPHLHANGAAGPSSNASSGDLSRTKSATGSSVSPFSSSGLPTPPSSTATASAPSGLGGISTTGSGLYPGSPSSNASHPSQTGLDSPKGYNMQLPGLGQQRPTNYYTKSPLNQQHDQKFSASSLPGYMNMTPSASGASSPYTPGGLLWNQWPADLPQIEIVKALAGTALAMISDTLFLLPADSVFRSLALPPIDPRFPSIALLHALCALGATTFPLPPEARGYWQDAPTASKYHFRQAKKHLQTFNASQVLDDLRASILLVIYSFAAEQFIDVWQLVGMSCRGLPATGLNHVQNHSALPSTKMGTTPGHFLRKPTYLAPAADDYEVFYRSTTMWMAFSSDVWMGACSGWAMAIDLQDITTLLPVWPSDTTPLDVVLNQPSLDPHSQLFFTSHLDSPMISLHLSIKAMVLMRRVIDFLQRSTAPDSVINLEAKKLVRSSPAFVTLIETIAAFQQNFPDKARYHLQTLPSGKLDSNLLNAHIIPCTALLLLYEPFIYGADDEGFYTGSMQAANRILQITHSVYAHSKDAISMYYTQINYSWMVCNRTLIRAMRFREDQGDQEAAKGLRSSIEFLLARNSTLAAQSPLVCSCLGMIENLVKDETPWHRQ